MSRTFFTVENLEFPFSKVLEKSFLAPTEGRWVRSSSRKIVYLIDGEGQHRFENQGLQPIRGGDILIVPEMTRQFYVGAAQTSRIHALCVLFDNTALPLMKPNEETVASTGDPESDTLEFCRHHFQHNYHLSNACDSVIQETLNQVRFEAERRSIGYRLRIASLCKNLTILTARLLTQDSELRLSSNGYRGGGYLVGRAKEFLHTNANKEIHFNQIASHLQVSEEHLSRTFKQVTGVSVFTYLRTVRLEQAKILLLNSDQNISEIALSSGFSSLALFSRKFKDYTGLSPLSYRREYGGNAAP